MVAAQLLLKKPMLEMYFQAVSAKADTGLAF